MLRDLLTGFVGDLFPCCFTLLQLPGGFRRPFGDFGEVGLVGVLGSEALRDEPGFTGRGGAFLLDGLTLATLLLM